MYNCFFGIKILVYASFFFFFFLLWLMPMGVTFGHLFFKESSMLQSIFLQRNLFPCDHLWQLNVNAGT